jgi:hypothetical protein
MTEVCGFGRIKAFPRILGCDGYMAATCCFPAPPPLAGELAALKCPR